MARLEWSDYAKLELERLTQYIAAENRQAAARVARLIRDQVSVLRQHPEIGAVYEDVPGVRRLVIKRTMYVVYYRVVGERVEVLSVQHSSRRPATAEDLP